MATTLIFLKIQKNNNDKKYINNHNQINSYVVKARKKEIFLYDNNNNIIKNLNIDYDSLREFDKEQLKKGLIIKNPDDLIEFIEDFTN